MAAALSPFGPKAWFYVDAWQWITPTWGGSGPRWVQVEEHGPVFDTAWGADVQAQLYTGQLRAQGAPYAVRQFVWTGSGWQRTGS